jgi:hypothetical protein
MGSVTRAVPKMCVSRNLAGDFCDHHYGKRDHGIEIGPLTAGMARPDGT